MTTELEHTALLHGNAVPLSPLIQKMIQGKIQAFHRLSTQNTAVISSELIASLIEEEARYGKGKLGQNRGLRTFSSGERQQAVINHVLEAKPEYLVLVNPFDNLDRQAVAQLKERLNSLSQELTLILFCSRKDDIPVFIQKYYQLGKSGIHPLGNLEDAISRDDKEIKIKIPPPPDTPKFSNYDSLVSFSKVSVNYSGKPVVKHISWEIAPGSYWELRGPNGSGKSTLLTLITGDNPKAYGQDITLFGVRKGSGESVWDIKKHIGYFTPGMMDRFRGNQSALNMLIGGLTDQIGLYIKPTDLQLKLANQWLEGLGLSKEKDRLFNRLSEGQKRLLLCARAMIKHPPLLILDEPTAGLDDSSAQLFVCLVNQFARSRTTAIIFVSHRDEPGLKAEKILELIPGPDGSSGVIR